ncbi:MAG: hypothetical protein HY048_19635 [Acidobacteria bacterium]|nr:hypothetical protein [Acidobacteriota bacterium]
MTLRIRIVVAAVWIGSLALVGSLASAQARRAEPAAVISGADIGFRPEGWQGKARTGTWLVRIDGQWVEAAGAPKVSPVTTR